MATRPSEDIRRQFEEARKMSTTTAAHEVAGRAASALAWMQGYLRKVEETIAVGDLQTFVNAPRERLFAKEEIASLLHHAQEIQTWISQQDTKVD